MHNPKGAGPFELRLLGTVELRRAGSPADGDSVGDAAGVEARPKRLALLAYLALQRPGAFLARERILAMLWPDLAPERARAALNQSLYTLRRTLGADVLVSRGDSDIGIDATLLHTDVEAFETELASGRLVKALERYRGDLLAGFFVAGATAFDEWLDRERTRLRARAREAAWTLAKEALAASDRVEAARWARQAHAYAEHDEISLAQLLDILRDAQDVGGAIAAYETYARWLEREYEDVPGPALQKRFAALLVQRTATAPETPFVGPSKPPPSALPQGPPRARRRAWARPLTLGAVGALVVATLVWGNTRPRPNADRIAVLPFDVQGDTRSAYLAEGMVNLLAASLDGAGAMRAVDSRALLGYLRGQAQEISPDVARGIEIARHFSAERFVLGVVLDIGGSLRATASLYDTDGVRLAQVEAYAATESDVFAMVDDLARGVLRATARTPAARYERLGADATRSLPALKEYLAGESHFRAARYPEAFDAYSRAVTLDTTFAIAHFRRAIAADWVDSRMDVLPSLAAAQRHAAQLDDHERRMMHGMYHYWTGSAVEADTTFVGLLRIWPDDVDAWFQYGELLFHQGPILGRPSVTAGTAFRRVLELHPTHEGARGHLARVAAMEGNAALADSLARLVGAADPAAHVPPDVALLHSLTIGDHARFSALVSALDREADYAIWVAGWRVATYTRDLEAAIRIFQAATTSRRASNSRGVAYLSIAHLEAGRGRWEAARAAIARAAPMDPVGAAYTEAFLIGLPFAPPVDSAAARRLLDGLPAPLVAARGDPALAMPPSGVPGDLAAPLALRGALALKLGDSAAARGQLRALERITDSTLRFSPVGPRTALRVLLALGATTRVEGAQLMPLGDSLGSATRGLAQMRRVPAYTYALENFVLGELLYSLGRDEEALDRYAAFGDEFGYEAVFYAPAHLRRSELLKRLGRDEESKAERARFESLWKEADAQARAHLARAIAAELRD